MPPPGPGITCFCPPATHYTPRPRAFSSAGARGTPDRPQPAAAEGPALLPACLATLLPAPAPCSASRPQSSYRRRWFWQGENWLSFPNWLSFAGWPGRLGHARGALAAARGRIMKQHSHGGVSRTWWWRRRWRRNAAHTHHSSGAATTPASPFACACRSRRGTPACPARCMTAVCMGGFGMHQSYPDGRGPPTQRCEASPRGRPAAGGTSSASVARSRSVANLRRSRRSPLPPLGIMWHAPLAACGHLSCDSCNGAATTPHLCRPAPSNMPRGGPLRDAPNDDPRDASARRSL